MTREQTIAAMREKLDERIKYCERHYGGPGCPLWSGDMTLLQEAQEALALLEAQDWVPVSERLPDENEVVLVLFKDRTFSLMVWDEDCLVTFSITHWSSIPKPPSEEG